MSSDLCAIGIATCAGFVAGVAATVWLVAVMIGTP